MAINTRRTPPPRTTLIHLKDWRLSQRLTQAELAEKAGISRYTIIRLEQGELCYGTTIRRLTAALRIRPEELLGEPRAARF